MKILHLDVNHPLLKEQLEAAGFKNDEDVVSSKKKIERILPSYEGIVLRSRFPIDKQFITAGTNLKFIARVGAGLENIDAEYAKSKGIELIAAPEGNRNAVSEHALGLLLSLFNKINKADREIHNGVWEREANRGTELDGKTIGIIGYGNTGKAFAKKLQGFDCEVLCCDILKNAGNAYARQTSLKELQEKSDVVSLHVPWTPITDKMVDARFIKTMKRPFWLLNTARGKNVVTADVVSALRSGKVLGAGLDVLEYEASSFETLSTKDVPVPLLQLLDMENVVLTPHIAGWTVESKEKLAQTIVDKIVQYFGKL